MITALQKKAAREILIGDFFFPSLTASHERATDLVSQIIERDRKGDVVMLSGTTGCGISALLANLARSHKDSIKQLNGDIYSGESNIVDHLCGAFELPSGSNKVAPEYLFKFAAITGRRTLIIDDLDIYIHSEKDVDSVFDFLRMLTEASTPLSVVISTRNQQLIRRFNKIVKKNWVHYVLTANVSSETFRRWASLFWHTCNSAYNLKVASPLSWQEAMIWRSADVTSCSKSLRYYYISCLIHSTGIVMPVLNEETIDEYEFEILSIINS